MRKLFGRKGFTLAEALIATAILALFVSMAIVGTSGLFGTGEEMMAVSKAAVLGSDVMKVITNELRFGESFKSVEGGESITYDSTTYGEGTSMKISSDSGREGELLIVSSPKNFVETGAEDGTGKSDKSFYPISSSSYDEVWIKSIMFTIETKVEKVKDEANIKEEDKRKRQVISCTLAVTSDGTNTLWEKTVTIVPISQKTELFLTESATNQGG